MIVIEGIDGAGKTTLAHYLKDKYKLPLFAFPDYKNFDIIKKFLHGEIKMNEKAAYLLFLANITAKQEEIEMAKKCIIDRYVFSTISYAHSVNLNIAMNVVKHLKLKMPKIVIYLDINPRVALKRKMQQLSNKGLSIRENIKVLEIVKKRYLYMASKNFLTKWYIINAENDVEEIKKEITGIVDKYI